MNDVIAIDFELNILFNTQNAKNLVTVLVDYLDRIIIIFHSSSVNHQKLTNAKN